MNEPLVKKCNYYLSLTTGSLLLEHYTRECEFLNFEEEEKQHPSLKTTTKKNTTKQTFSCVLTK